LSSQHRAGVINLFLWAGSFEGIRFSISWKEIKIIKNQSTSLKINPLLWKSILEDVTGLGVFTNWVVWIHEELQLDWSHLVHIRTIHLVHIIHLENKRNSGGWGLSLTEWGKAVEDLENLIMAILKIDWLNRNVITVIDVDRTIANYDLFYNISITVSCISKLSKIDCNMIQIIGIIVHLTKIVISVMGSMCHTSHLWTNINHH
jgi:hypothetical protein